MKAAFLVHSVAKAGVAPVAQTLFCIDIHASPYLLGQLGGVIFGHAFQHALHQNAACVIADVFSCGNYTDAILFQLCLVDGAVIAVSGETVKLINQNALKCVLVAVGNHALELGPAVCGAALRTVNVFANHNMPIGPGVVIAGLKLPFDGLLGLAMTGIAGIDDNIHSLTSRSICKSVSFSRSFMGEFGSKHISTNFSIAGSLCSILGLYSYSLPCGLSVRPKI